MAVIPADYWQLNYWSYRSPGHSTFTCPKVSVKQPIYFAYCYYLYQARANPNLTQWFQQKRSALQGKGPEPGPRPFQGREYNRAQRSAHPSAQRRGSQRQVHLIYQPQFIGDDSAVEQSPPHVVGPGDTDEENEFGHIWTGDQHLPLSILPVVPHPLPLDLRTPLRRGLSAPIPLNLEQTSSETPLGSTRSIGWTKDTIRSLCHRDSPQCLIPLTVRQSWRRLIRRRNKQLS